MSKRKKVITTQLEQQFDETFQFIQQDSSQNAEKFAQQLNEKLEKIEEHPTAFSPEPNLPTKKNWYRFAIVMRRWKVIYKVTNSMLVFLGIVHTARHPDEIKKLRTNKYDE